MVIKSLTVATFVVETGSFGKFVIFATLCTNLNSVVHLHLKAIDLH